MDIYPDCENKFLHDCRVGEVVRLVGTSRKGEFAIYSDIDGSDDKALIVMTEEGPLYTIVNASEKVRVLAYGLSCFLEVDHKGPFEPRAHRMYERAGCVIREESRWLMNVQMEHGRFAHHRAQFDMTRSRLVKVSDELGKIAVFGKWALYLGDRSEDADRWIEIASFEWQPATTGVTN